MWTKEAPEEAGSYYWRPLDPEYMHEDFLVVTFHLNQEWELCDERGPVDFDNMEPGEWLPVPDPARLAALLRLAEAALNAKQKHDELDAVGPDCNPEFKRAYREYRDAYDQYFAALDAVREATR